MSPVFPALARMDQEPLGGILTGFLHLLISLNTYNRQLQVQVLWTCVSHQTNGTKVVPVSCSPPAAGEGPTTRGSFTAIVPLNNP